MELPTFGGVLERYVRMCEKGVNETYCSIKLQRTAAVITVEVLQDQANHKPDRDPPVPASTTIGRFLSEKRYRSGHKHASEGATAARKKM